LFYFLIFHLLYRVGAMVSPYISLVVIQSNNGLILCLCIFGAFAFLTVISSFLLPKVFIFFLILNTNNIHSHKIIMYIIVFTAIGNCGSRISWERRKN
jgi:hypothetical protein